MSNDACPRCGTEVLAVPGMMLGQASVGPAVNPKPWQEVADCPKCGASLIRIPGDPWRDQSPSHPDE